MAKLPDLRIKELSLAYTTYERALRDGWRPKQAIYIAWASHTPSARKAAGLPVTANELASALGSRAKKNQANLFAAWRKRYTAADGTSLDDYIDDVGVRESVLWHYRPAAMAAMAETATIIGRDGHADRKMFFEMTGDYQRQSAVDVTSDGERIHIDLTWGDNAPD